MTTGYTDTAALNSLFNAIYNDAWFVFRTQNVMANLVTTYTDRQGIEDRVASKYPKITAGSVTETQDYANPAVMDKTEAARITPSVAIAQAILTDRRIRTDPRTREDTAMELGNAISDKVETDLTSKFGSLTGGTIGAAGSVLTWGHLFAARAVLAGGSVPGPYISVLHEYQWFPLGKAASVAGSRTNAPEGLLNDVNRRWYVGTYADVSVFTTPHISIDGSGDAIGALFNPIALVLDIRQGYRLEVERDASFGGGAWELDATMDYGAGAWRKEAGVQIVSDAAVPTS